MGKREFEDDVQETAEEASSTVADNGRYPGDIVKDRKTGRKGKFVNEYGTNGRAIIVIPEGQTRSELWDAAQAEIIKKVKRPVQDMQATAVARDPDDEDIEDEEPIDE